MTKGFIGALIGGVIGAAIWAAIAYFSGYELGIIAWLLGGVVGLGMALGAGDESDTPTGVVAAMVAIGAIALGKFTAIHFLVERDLNKMYAEEAPITLDDAKVYLAEQLVDEYTAAGKPLTWPEGMTYEEASVLTDYPTDLQKDVEARWATLSPDVHEQYRVAVEQFRVEGLSMAKSAIKDMAFKESFSMWDAIWILLAVATAFKVGAGLSGD